MENQAIGSVRNSDIQFHFPVCAELTPSNVGNMSARILAVASAAQGSSDSEIRTLIADRFGKRYDNLEDFAAKLRFLVSTGHVREEQGRFLLTDKGASLMTWIQTARPQMLDRSHSANEDDRPH